MEMHIVRENKQLLKELGEEYNKWDGTPDYESNDYQSGIQMAKPDNRLLFIHGNPTGEKSEIIIELVNKALKKGFRIALINKWKEKLGQDKKIYYFKKNSPEYFKRLTEAKYIYATANLNYYFSKTDRQVMIVDLDSYDRKDFDNRVKVDSTCCHTNWIITDETSRQKIFKKLLTKRLRREKQKLEKANEEKEYVLFIINTAYYDRTFEYILNIQNKIDYSRYDVTVLFAISAKERYKKQMNRLNSEIHVVFRRGNLICDEETNRKLSFLDEKNFDLPDIAVVDSFLGEDTYQREVRRLFGIKRFDYVFNMRYDGIRWRLFVNALSGKKVFYDLESYVNPTAWMLSKLKHLNMYDEIMFPNEDMRNLAVECAPEIFQDKACVAAQPFVCGQEDMDVTCIRIGDNRFCVADTNIVSEVDSLSALLVKSPKEKTAYVTISPECTGAYAGEQLRNILYKGIHPVVFDFGRVLVNNEIVEKVDYYIRYSSSNVLKPVLGEWINIKSGLSKEKVCAIDKLLLKNETNNV